MKKLLSIFLVLFCINANSNECEVQNPSLENISEYLFKVAESLTEVKIQSKGLTSLDEKKDKDLTDALVAIKELRNGLTCSSKIIGSYKKSKNKTISESADALSKSYQLLADEFGTSITEVKDKLDGKEGLPLGEKADKESDTRLKIKKNWGSMMDAIELGASARVEQFDPKTQKPKKFFITKSERDLIVKQLKSQFKFPIKKSKTEAIDEVANFYYDILTKETIFK